MAKLTDKQKKKIIADYVESGSYSATARKFKVNPSTVKRVIDNNPNVQKKAEQKKEENTIDMLTFLDSRKDKAQQFIDLCFAALLSPEKVGAAQLSQITTAMGTMIDKFADANSIDEKTLEKARELLGGVKSGF